MSDAAGEVPVDRRELLYAAAVALGLALVWIGVAHHHGALGAARNDDWDAYHLTFRFVREGIFEPTGWLAMTFIGQALLAWPVVVLAGESIVALQLEVAVLAAVGLWATYLLLRAFLPRGWSCFCVATLALGPIYGSLAASFMTDVPAYTAQVLALLLAQRAVRSERLAIGWLAAAFALAWLAFSIREHAAPAGTALALVGLGRASTRRDRLVILVMAILWSVAIVALYAWRLRLPHDLDRNVGWLLRGGEGLAAYLRRAGFDLGIFVAPAVFALSPWRLVKAVGTRARLAALAAIAACLAILRYGYGPIFFLGNYFTWQGSYATTLVGERPTLVPGNAWIAIVLVAAVGWIGTAVIGSVGLVRQPRLLLPTAKTALVASFVALTLALQLVMLTFTLAPMFDRYLISLVPFVAGLLVAIGRAHASITRLSRGVAIAALAASALVGFIYVDASATFDGARWRLAREIVALGYPAAAVDGGLDWYGYHHPGVVDPKAKRHYVAYWIDHHPGHGPVCVSLALPQVQPVLGNLLAERRAVSLTGVEYHLRATRGPDVCPVPGGPPRPEGP